MRDRVPENIADGNYFLIRRSIARLKIRSTIHGLRRSYLYLSHERGIYNTYGDPGDPYLPSLSLTLTVCYVLKLGLTSLFTLAGAESVGAFEFGGCPHSYGKCSEYVGKRVFRRDPQRKNQHLNCLSSWDHVSVYPLASHHSDDRAQLPPALQIFLHPPSNHILSPSLVHSPNLSPGKGSI